MAVYMVVEIEVKDSELYAQYVDRVWPVVKAHGGRYLVRGGQVTPLGGGWDPGRVVIIHFESLGQLRGCFASPAYRALAPLREAATDSRAFAVEGYAVDDEQTA